MRARTDASTDGRTQWHAHAQLHARSHLRARRVHTLARTRAHTLSGLWQSIRSEQHFALMKLVVPLLLQLHRACRSPHNVPKHELEFPKAGAELRAKAATTANLVDTVRSCLFCERISDGLGTGPSPPHRPRRAAYRAVLTAAAVVSGALRAAADAARGVLARGGARRAHRRAARGCEPARPVYQHPAAHRGGARASRPCCRRAGRLLHHVPAGWGLPPDRAVWRTSACVAAAGIPRVA